MELIDLVRNWAAESYGPNVVEFEAFLDQYYIYINSFPQGAIHESFIVMNPYNFMNTKRSHGNEYLYPEDPKFFKKLKSLIDITIHYRDSWANEINDEESEMLFEETYYYGGYAT